jgi:ABC-type dipeptide/oligopeptide/nickel transport system ATPase subunit
MDMVVQERVVSILEQLRTLSTLVYALLQPTLGTIERKNSRVRLLEDMMSGEFQSAETDA